MWRFLYQRDEIFQKFIQVFEEAVALSKETAKYCGIYGCRNSMSVKEHRSIL